MRKKIIFLFMILAVAVMGTACSKKETLTEYLEHASEDTYAFVNMEKNTAEMDEGFQIDGVLDEAAYSSVKPLLLRKEYGQEIGTITFICYMGEKGVYIGASVYDSAGVYYNEVRGTTQNSGVEFYLATDDVGTDRIGSFEIDMAAGGELSFKCRAADNRWIAQMFPYDEAPIYAAKTSGKINSENCKNYVCELFIPYDAAGIKEKPEVLYLGPCLITKYHDELETEGADRNHYNFMGTQLVYGAGKNTYPDCMYYFDENGASVYNLGIDVTGKGNVREEFGGTCIARGDDIKLFIEAEKKSRIASFKVNGKECKDKLYTDLSGDTYYLYQYVDKDVYVDATFEAIPEETFTVSGKVQCSGVAGDAYSDLRLRMHGLGKEYEASYDANARAYSLNVPAGDYHFEIYSAKGKYVVVSKDISVSKNMNLGTTTITSAQYGNAREIAFDETKMMKWTKKIFEGSEKSDNFVYSAFMGCLNEVTEGKFITHTTLTYEKEKQNQTFYLQYIVSEGTHRVQLMSRGVVKLNESITLNATQTEFAERRHGVGLAMEKNGDKISIYIENEDGTYSALLSDFRIKGSLVGEEVFLTGISFGATDDAGFEQPSVLRSAKLFLNKGDHNACVKRSTYTIDKNDAYVTVSGVQMMDNKAFAKLNVNAKKNNLFLQVRNNGVAVSSEGSTYTFPVLLYNELEVFSFPKKLVTMTLDMGDTYPIKGMEIYAVNTDTDKEICGIVAGNKIALTNIQNGAWDIYAKILGAKVKLNSFIVEDSGTYSLDIGEAFASVAALKDKKINYDFASCSAYYPAEAKKTSSLKSPVELDGAFKVTAKYKISEADVLKSVAEQQFLNFGMYVKGDYNDGFTFYVHKNGSIYIRNGKYAEQGATWGYLRNKLGSIKNGVWKHTEWSKALTGDGLWITYERTEDGTVNMYFGETKDSQTFVGTMGDYKNIDKILELTVQFNHESGSSGYAASVENIEVTIP